MILSIAESRPRNIESVQVDTLLPETIRQSSESLVKFLEEYYNYLNTEGLPSTEINRIQTIKDIDLTTNKYLDEIEKLIALNVPESRGLDRVSLYKIIIKYLRLYSS